MSETIPVIDIADYVAGRPGALGAVVDDGLEHLRTPR